MVKVKTFTSQLKIFHAMHELEGLDRAINDFIEAGGIKKVVSVSDAVTTGAGGETIGIIRSLTYEEPPAGFPEYQKKVEATLNEWGNEIEKIRVKAEGLGAEARRGIQRQLDDLHGRQEEARKKLAELKRSGGEAWEDLRTGADSALDDLRKAVDRALAKIKSR